MTSFFKNLTRQFSQTSAAGIVPSANGGAVDSVANSAVAIVSNGCFWGTEHMFREKFSGKGLLKAEVGYIGGKTEQPSYRQVCTGTTDHAESLKVTFDPSKISYEKLIKFHYAMHDASTLNRQGGDRGTQYRSAIFYLDDEQKAIAEKVTAEVQAKFYKDSKITTQIADGRHFKWYTAEDYHQEYLHKEPAGYQCPAHYIRFDIEKL